MPLGAARLNAVAGSSEGGERLGTGTAGFRMSVSSEAAPLREPSEAYNKLVRATFLLVTKSRLLEVNRKWGGVNFEGTVYGVRPDDWKDAFALFREVEEELLTRLSGVSVVPPEPTP